MPKTKRVKPPKPKVVTREEALLALRQVEKLKRSDKDYHEYDKVWRQFAKTVQSAKLTDDNGIIYEVGHKLTTVKIPAREEKEVERKRVFVRKWDGQNKLVFGKS